MNIAVDELDDAAIEIIHAHGHEQGLRLGIERGQVGERAAGFAQAKQAFCLSFPVRSVAIRSSFAPAMCWLGWRSRRWSPQAWVTSTAARSRRATRRRGSDVR